MQRDIMDKCAGTLVASKGLPIMDRRIFPASPTGIKSRRSIMVARAADGPNFP
jgi:acyl CoA:acetate/3-ketoacid CoA transferase